MTHLTRASRPVSARSLWTQLAAQAAAVAGVAMITFGLLSLGSGEAWAQSAQRPETGIWAVRCLALALIAGGQVVFVAGVLPAFFNSRGSLQLGLGLSLALLAVLAGVASAALAAAAGW